MKFKMVATAGLKFNIGPYGKNVSKRYFSETIRTLKPNCPGMIIGWSSTKFMFYKSIGNPRWPPPQYID
jgi:hypothetical protein